MHWDGMEEKGNTKKGLAQTHKGLVVYYAEYEL